MLRTALSLGSDNFDYTIFGTTSCSDVPWSDTDCPVGVGNRALSGSTTVTYVAPGQWQVVGITFTTTVDIAAIVFGPSCARVPIRSTDTLNSPVTIQETEDCGLSRLSLEYTIKASPGTSQWYKDGTDIAGKNAAQVDVSDLRAGSYTVEEPNGGERAQKDIR